VVRFPQPAPAAAAAGGAGRASPSQRRNEPQAPAKPPHPTRPKRTPRKRSAIMRAAVKSRDTRPELLLRTMLRSIKTGYRLHRADLPGKPDVVYGPHRLAIFMHGCFWHGHDCKRGASRSPRKNARLLERQDRRAIARVMWPTWRR